MAVVLLVSLLTNPKGTLKKREPHPSVSAAGRYGLMMPTMERPEVQWSLYQRLGMNCLASIPSKPAPNPGKPLANVKWNPLYSFSPEFGPTTSLHQTTCRPSECLPDLYSRTPQWPKGIFCFTNTWLRTASNSLRNKTWNVSK